jgi:hypothetical protein
LLTKESSSNNNPISNNFNFKNIFAKNVPTNDNKNNNQNKYASKSDIDDGGNLINSEKHRSASATAAADAGSGILDVNNRKDEKNRNNNNNDDYIESRNYLNFVSLKTSDRGYSDTGAVRSSSLSSSQSTYYTKYKRLTLYAFERSFKLNLKLIQNSDEFLSPDFLPNINNNNNKNSNYSINSTNNATFNQTVDCFYRGIVDDDVQSFAYINLCHKGHVVSVNVAIYY